MVNRSPLSSIANWSGHQPTYQKVVGFITSGVTLVLLLPSARNFSHVTPVNQAVNGHKVLSRHEAIMLQKLSIMLLSNAPKITYYAFKIMPIIPKIKPLILANNVSL